MTKTADNGEGPASLSVAAALAALCGPCRSFFGPEKSFKAIVATADKPCGAKKGTASASTSKLVSTPASYLHAIDGDPTATTLLLESIDNQLRTAGSGSTWLVVVAGLMYQRMMSLLHDGVPLHWVLHWLDEGLELCEQVTARCTLPLTEVAAAFSPHTLQAQLDAMQACQLGGDDRSDRAVAWQMGPPAGGVFGGDSSGAGTKATSFSSFSDCRAHHHMASKPGSVPVTVQTGATVTTVDASQLVRSGQVAHQQLQPQDCEAEELDDVSWFFDACSPLGGGVSVGAPPDDRAGREPAGTAVTSTPCGQQLQPCTGGHVLAAKLELEPCDQQQHQHQAAPDSQQLLLAAASLALAHGRQQHMLLAAAALQLLRCLNPERPLSTLRWVDAVLVQELPGGDGGVAAPGSSRVIGGLVLRCDPEQSPWLQELVSRSCMEASFPRLKLPAAAASSIVFIEGALCQDTSALAGPSTTILRTATEVQQYTSLRLCDAQCEALMRRCRTLGVGAVACSSHVPSALVHRAFEAGGLALISGLGVGWLRRAAAACGVSPVGNLASAAPHDVAYRVRWSVVARSSGACLPSMPGAVAAATTGTAQQDTVVSRPSVLLLLQPGATAGGVRGGAASGVVPITLLLQCPVADQLVALTEGLAACYARLHAVLARGALLPGAGVYELLTHAHLMAQLEPTHEQCSSSWQVMVAASAAATQPQCSTSAMTAKPVHTLTPSPRCGDVSSLHHCQRELPPPWARFNACMRCERALQRGWVLQAVSEACKDAVAVLLQNRGATYATAVQLLTATETMLSASVVGVKAAGPNGTRQLTVLEVTLLQRTLHQGMIESNAEHVRCFAGGAGATATEPHAFVGDDPTARAAAWQTVRLLLHAGLGCDIGIATASGRNS